MKGREFELPGGVVLHESLVVGEGVVIEEETRGDVERDEHVDGVVFVRCKNEEYPEHIHHPRQDVQQVQAARCVCNVTKTYFLYIASTKNKYMYLKFIFFYQSCILN